VLRHLFSLDPGGLFYTYDGESSIDLAEEPPDMEGAGIYSTSARCMKLKRRKD